MAPVRPPTAADRDRLARLMLDAYVGTIDYEGETIVEAGAEVDRWLASPEAMPGASLVAVEADEIVSAALLSRVDDMPMVAYLYTDPAWKGRGLAEGLLSSVMTSLGAAGHERIHLWVTAGNAPAERIYERLGFVDVPEGPTEAAVDRVAALHLAGHALAHAAWSVEDGEALVPLAITEIDGQRGLVRYEAESVLVLLEAIRMDLGARLSDGDLAAVAFDSYATTADGMRTDALTIDVLGPGGRSVGRLVQPYRAARRSRIPFIGRPSPFAILDGLIVSDRLQVAGAEGVVLAAAREHPQAGRLFET